MTPHGVAGLVVAVAVVMSACAQRTEAPTDAAAASPAAAPSPSVSALSRLSDPVSSPAPPLFRPKSGQEVEVQLHLPSDEGRLQLSEVITGEISPKSVVASGTGLIFAQNMMYRHTVTVYNRRGTLVNTIPDAVDLSEFGFEEYEGEHRGAPVEAAFSPDGRYAYVSNYSMYGPGFGRAGSDTCSPASGYDDSFVYRIDTSTLEIDKAIEVGSVPKFVAVTPDDRFVLVTNWCAYTLSVISVTKAKEVRQVELGRYPRGIAVSPDAKTAYVAVMGTANIARVDLEDFDVDWIEGVGAGPRHLTIDARGRYLYATLNGDGAVAKINLRKTEVVARVATGTAPRSMAIADDGNSLYVVNYHSNTVSKVRTRDMKVIQTVETNHHPIGITYDAETSQVWVACYSGSIMVFTDHKKGNRDTG
jgi:YVTN family beta-propeller protein